MKKLNLLIGFLIGLIILSCSKEDESVNQDPIIGNWKLKSVKRLDLDEVLISEESLSECEERNVMTFSSNQDYTFSQFNEDPNGGCYDSVQSISNGIWSYSSTNGYQISGMAIFELVIVDLSQIYDEMILSNNNKLLTLRKENRVIDAAGNLIYGVILIQEYSKE
ncbi:Lipocalin-like domain-containing protein [Tenacibaculum sp. MAR_2009_124]|uniref:lipocalin family protein n=1 Tax=Tenacibaculum sp. MAR_2009_124 TaxID=1250059 RepID=UPI00089A4CA5|nr:lipocalin family protein [Tenacibaculum sp. MAR_2009_124]SED05606.1 Lipocalin-like domain-containing protein [Tenacibaculum sp. MAR_2009_124]